MWNLDLRLGKCLTDVSTILKNAAKLRIISEITKTFQKIFVILASPKVLSLENAQIYLAFYSLIRTFAPKIVIIWRLRKLNSL